jgi:hypothetical protein
MAFTEVAVARNFDELARMVDRDSSLEVRIRRADGSVIDGTICEVEYPDVVVVDEAGGRQIEVFAHELETLDVKVPRRGREWMLAIVGIAAGVSALVGYAQLPWVPPRPGEEDLIPAFLLLTAIITGLSSMPRVRDRVAPWFTRWHRLYPGAGQTSGVRRIERGGD